MQTYITSSFFRLNSNDYFKGLKVALFSGLLTFIYPFLVQHTLPKLSDTLYVAAIACVGYLIKNLFTPSTIVTPSAS